MDRVRFCAEKTPTLASSRTLGLENANRCGAIENTLSLESLRTRSGHSSNGVGGYLVREDERLADELAWIGARPGNELVYPTAVPAGDIDVAILVHVELVRTRQATHKAAPRPSVRPPVVLELAVPAVLQNTVQ